MKKLKLLMALMFILLSMNVLSANPPAIVDNRTIGVLTESFTIVTEVNETSLISYSLSTGGNEIFRTTFDTNDTTAYIFPSGLEGNTLYNWQVNFTSLGETTVIRNSVTTDSYILLGVIRTLMNLFALIIAAFAMIRALSSNESAKTKGVYMMTIVVLTLTALAFINGILAA